MNIGIHGLVKVIPKHNVTCRLALLNEHVIEEMNDKVISRLDTKGWATHHDVDILAPLSVGDTPTVSEDIALEALSLGNEVGRVEVFASCPHVKGDLEFAIAA